MYLQNFCFSLLIPFLLLPALLQAESILPRKVLGLYDSQAPRNVEFEVTPKGIEEPFPDENPIQDNLAVVLNHLGYLLETLDVQNQPLPDPQSMQDYALVISWFKDYGSVPYPKEYVQWVEALTQQGIKFLMVGYPGITDDELTSSEAETWTKRLYRTLDLEYDSNPQTFLYRIKVQYEDPQMLGFERVLPTPLPWYDQLRPTKPTVRSFLQVHYSGVEDSQSHLITVSQHGGFIAPGYALYQEPAEPFRRQWYLNPFLYLRTLLQPQHPIPDVTTHQGKRLYYSHIDGDGFRNFSEVQLQKYSAEVVLKEIFEKYPEMPVGVSVIVGDIDPNWYGNERLMEVAQQIFELPQIEAASHTYTHPYQWKGWDRNSAYTVTGHTRYEREIDEAVDWINENLLSANKEVTLVYWSGDTTPPESAIIRAQNKGLPNLNGGDARKDTHFPSYTSVSPLMRHMGNSWQVFTSASNENLYTELWTNRFHGFRNVIQTFKNTESPIRLLPVNVYYHFYIADKVASLQSLKTVLEWVRSQDLYYMFPSEYVQWVHGFISAEIVKVEAGMYEIRNRGALQTLRLDSGRVDVKQSIGIQQMDEINNTLYLSLDPNVPTPRIRVLLD